MLCAFAPILREFFYDTKQWLKPFSSSFLNEQLWHPGRHMSTTGPWIHAGRSTWTLHTLSPECPSPQHHASEPHPPSPAQNNQQERRKWRPKWGKKKMPEECKTPGAKERRGPIKSFILTFEARKQKADCLVLALSGSTTSRPFSSSRHRYRPVVMWRIRKDCPHFMWLPLQL